MTPPHARFTALLHEHRGILHKLAAVYTRTAADRQDLAQEIAAQLWRSFPRYDPGRPFSTWMYRVALNVAMTRLRQERPLASLDAPGPDGLAPIEALTAPHDDESAECVEQVQLLRAVIDAQAPLDRALLLLWLDERPHREIAEVLGISESNVGTKLDRLRQKIRRVLQERETR